MKYERKKCVRYLPKERPGYVTEPTHHFLWGTESDLFSEKIC